MTLEELRNCYTRSELTYTTGDPDFRRKLYSPFLSDLYENKVVYDSRSFGLIQLSDINMDAECFAATASLVNRVVRPDLQDLEDSGRYDFSFKDKEWKIRISWEYMILHDNDCLSAQYAGFRIWVEKFRVKRFIELLDSGDEDAARKLTIYKEEGSYKVD